MKQRVILTAEEGMVLTNGTDYGKVVWLAEGASPEDYRAIPMQEYEAILAQQAPYGVEVYTGWN